MVFAASTFVWFGLEDKFPLSSVSDFEGEERKVDGRFEA
jgi:hypothetical protein